MKLLAFGDLQLGLHGRLDDQQAALKQILRLASEREVDVILNGGDTFEGPAITPEQLDVFADFVADADQAGIPVVATSGNGRHDAAVRITNGLAIFEHISGCYALTRPDIVALDGVVVAGLPWVNPRRMIARAGSRVPRAEVVAQTASLLVDAAAQLREDCACFPDVPAVLLLHFSIAGATLPTGLPADAVEDVVLPLDDLLTLGFDAIVASHIHRPQLLNEEPPVLFTGSPLAHDFGEADFDHGCWIIDLDASSTEFVPLQHRPLITVEEHLGAHDQLGLEIAVAGSVVDGAIARVLLHGSRDELRCFDLAALRRVALDAGAVSIQITPKLMRTQRARVTGVDEQLDELQALDAWLAANSMDGGAADLLRNKTREYLEAIA